MWRTAQQRTAATAGAAWQGGGKLRQCALASGNLVPSVFLSVPTLTLFVIVCGASLVIVRAVASQRLRQVPRKPTLTLRMELRAMCHTCAAWSRTRARPQP